MLCCAKSLEKMTFGQVISIGIVCLVCYGRICVFMGELAYMGEFAYLPVRII